MAALQPLNLNDLGKNSGGIFCEGKEGDYESLACIICFVFIAFMWRLWGMGNGVIPDLSYRKSVVYGRQIAED